MYLNINENEKDFNWKKRHAALKKGLFFMYTGDSMCNEDFCKHFFFKRLRQWTLVTQTEDVQSL